MTLEPSPAHNRILTLPLRLLLAVALMSGLYLAGAFLSPSMASMAVPAASAATHNDGAEKDGAAATKTKAAAKDAKTSTRTTGAAGATRTTVSEDAYLARELREPAEPQGFGLGRAILQMVVSLVVIIGLIYLTVWLLRRFGVGQFGGSAQRGNMVRPVSSTPLGPQHAIHVVSVGGKALIVGVYDKGMTLLGEVTDEETLSQIDSEISQAEVSFADLLQGHGGRAAGVMRAGGAGPWLQAKLDRLRLMTARGASTREEGEISGSSKGDRERRDS